MVFALLCAACSQYDDSSIWDELQDHEERITALEALCRSLNDDIASQQKLVAALEAGEYVTAVEPIVQDGAVSGYVIRFSGGRSVSVYHGEDGSDGADGYAPEVGFASDSDGGYYWTVDGKWMTGADGAKVPACGEAGENGEGGIVPKLKIEGGYWYVSCDGGVSWERLAAASVENGSDGASFFQGVDVSNEDFVVFTFADGQQVKLPTTKAFAQLQELVNRLNTNASGLQGIAESLRQNNYVSGIEPIVRDGAEVGYTIYFTEGDPVTVYHGKDGADGEDGGAGENGYVPVISMQAGADGGYYWTLDGEWILSADGERLMAVGADGNDGVTPQLKIEGGFWYVSYDGGSTWEDEPLGRAVVASDGGCLYDLSYDKDYVYVTLADGEVLKLARMKQGPLTVEPIAIDGASATLAGRFEVAAADLPYSQVAVYYAETTFGGAFNVYTSECVYVTDFDDEGRFTIEVPALKYGATYRYCVGAKVRSEVVYTDVEEFSVESFGYGRELKMHFETGTFTGSGYFYTVTTASVINGFAAPVLKSRMPERIDALQFIVKGLDEEVQPLTAYVAYLTDPDKIGTMTVIKSCTNNVQMTKAFSKVTLPLSLTREELAIVPDDGVLYVGYYPPEGFNQKPIGCGYTSSSDVGFVETPGHKGMYHYWNVSRGVYVSAISTQKNPRYAAFVTLE